MRGRLPFLAVALTSAQLLAIPAAAQVPDPGARVRATVRGGSLRYVGSFRDVTAGTLSISGETADGPPRQLLLSSLGSLEVSRGRSKGGGATGAVLGGFLGAAAGGLVGYAIGAGGTGEYAELAGIVYGGGAGLLVGLVGGYIGGAHERWRQLDLNDLRGR